MSCVMAEELKKGDRIQLRNGWYATLEDNQRKRSTRMATVEGVCTEMGSIYTSDIRYYIDAVGQTFLVLHTTKAQAKASKIKAQLQALGFAG